MTTSDYQPLALSIKEAIEQQHPHESAEQHEFRLANALRGLFENKSIRYMEELYPAEVKGLMSRVCSEATHELWKDPNAKEPITLPGEALGWINTVLTAIEEEMADGLKWLPEAHTTDAEIRARVTDAGYYDDNLGHSRMVDLLIAMRDLDVSLTGCRRLSEPEACNG